MRMKFCSAFVVLALATSQAAIQTRESCSPYVPGEPGGKWSAEELKIVRRKIEKLIACQQDASETGNMACFEGTDMLDETKGGRNKVKPLHQFCPDCDKLGPMLPDHEVIQNVTWKVGKEKFSGTVQLTRGDNPYRSQIITWRTNNQRNMWKHRGPRFSRLIQLAFHDCLKYKGGEGGCDGCINWSEMGWAPYAINKWGFPEPGEDEEAAATGSADKPIDDRTEVIKLWETMHETWPKMKHTSNNKLQLAARSLELIYTRTDWPKEDLKEGEKELDCSLQASGKSRADLWAFAGQVGIEAAIKYSNMNCQNEDATGNLEYQLAAIEGVKNCMFGIRGERKKYAFSYGRIDCTEKNTDVPYPFVASKTEGHANAYGSGNAAVEALKETFGLTPKETMSMMAVHGLANFGANTENVMKYNWIGGSQKVRDGAPDGTNIRASPASFSNMYHKILKGQFFRSRMKQGYDDGMFVGDADGNPVWGAGWGLQCMAVVKRNETGESRIKNKYHGGPCNFHVTKPGCASQTDDSKVLRQPCFRLVSPDKNVKANKLKEVEYKDSEGNIKTQRFEMINRKACKKTDAKVVRRDGKRGWFQIGGPPITSQEQKQQCKPSSISFAMPYEVGLAMKFTVDEDNIPGGCAQLDSPWKSKRWDRHGTPVPKHILPGGLGQDGDVDNVCERQDWADDLDDLANNSFVWQENFLNGWEKITTNGYSDLKMSDHADAELKIWTE